LSLPQAAATIAKVNSNARRRIKPFLFTFPLFKYLARI
ncbi:MAG: hypothetical protein ACI85J_001557, partial [Candidatus Poriferisodalaceae bacterium]